MKTHRWKDIRRKGTAEQEAETARWVEAQLLEMDLRAVRELVDKTQAEAAKAAEMTQAELSKLERREDHLISTLRRYVKALGGELEVRAVFGDKSVRLHGV